MIIETLIRQGSRVLKANNIASHSIDSEILMSKKIKQMRRKLKYYKKKKMLKTLC